MDESQRRELAVSYFQPGTDGWMFQIREMGQFPGEDAYAEHERKAGILLKVLTEWKKVWDDVTYPQLTEKRRHGGTDDLLERYKKAAKGRGNPDFLIDPFNICRATACTYESRETRAFPAVRGIGVQIPYAREFPYGGIMDPSYHEQAKGHWARIDLLARYFFDRGVPCSYCVTTFNPWDNGQTSPGFRPQNYLGIVFKLDLLSVEELQRALMPIWNKVAGHKLRTQYKKAAEGIEKNTPEVFGESVGAFMRKKLAALLEPFERADPCGRPLASQAERDNALQLGRTLCGTFNIHLPENATADVPAFLAALRGMEP